MMAPSTSLCIAENLYYLVIKVRGQKKNGNLFDVTMGSYDGAEICELVGLYLLHELNKTIKNQHLGLCRDNGLAMINSKSGPIIKRIKKNIATIFQNNGLKITTESNLLRTDFLDIILNLITGKYWPYRKPGDIPLYINAKSNHPPNIKKQIPKIISSRLSKNSYSLQEFDKTIPEYQLTLEKKRIQRKITYVKEEPKQINSTQPQKTDQETEQERLFGSTLFSMVKSPLTLAKNFLPFSIYTFHLATNTTKFLTKTT